MTITVELDPDIALRLQEEARRSGESVDAVAGRVLTETLRKEQRSKKGFRVTPFALDVPEKYRGLTPKQIDYEMEMEAYEEKLRAGSIKEANLAPRKPFVVKPIEGMKLPPEWTSGSVQELIEMLEGHGAR